MAAIAFAVAAPVHAATAETTRTAVDEPGRSLTRDPGRLFVAVAGLAALALGVTGAIMVLRSRRRAAAEPAAPTPPLVERPPTSVTAVVMLCPTCRREYGAGARFCQLDGNRLVGIKQGVGARGPTGGICPICEHGFDPGVVACPSHGEELIPLALYARARHDDQVDAKICPTCGQKSPGSSGFCGSDGTQLVIVN